MRAVSALFALSIAATAAASPVAQSDKAEAKIAQALTGRVAGKPTDCIIQQNIRASRIIDGTAILYEMNNGTIFVNRPTSGATLVVSRVVV